MSAQAAPLTHCPNCDHRLAPWDHFCSQCGQDTKNHPPSLWEFVHEWVLHYLALEGKLWKSLWALVAKPGFLTLEYLAGRKQRYVLPLRLVLTLGLLFFVVLKLSPTAVDRLTPPNADTSKGVLIVDEDDVPARSSQPASVAARPSVAASAPADIASQPAAEPHNKSGVIFRLPEDWMARLPTHVRRGLDATNERGRQNLKQELGRIGGAMLSMAPYAVLMSLPLFAALLKLLYWRLPYGAHFVFAMHLHAAWYGMLLLVVLMPWFWVALATWAWSNLYPLLALKRVHRAGWWSTLGRGSILALMHWVLIGLTATALLFFGAVAGH